MVDDRPLPRLPDDAVTHPCRIVLLGAAQSGKSALVSQFAFHEFCDEYVPTSLDTVCCPACVDGLSYTVKITDCCADESFAKQRETYMRSADIVVLVYSVTDKASLEFLRTAVQQARDAQMYTRKGFFPVFVVGTHSDATQAERQVSWRRAEEVAREICLSHAELVRPLFLRAAKTNHETAVQDGVRSLVNSVWEPSQRVTSEKRMSSSSSLSPAPSPPPPSSHGGETDTTPPASLPQGASSTVPFMELSARDDAAVATLFEALIRLHVIASTAHDLHMPVKTTPITSPITVAAPPSVLADDHAPPPPLSGFPAPAAAAAMSGSFSSPHQRTFSAASSSATAGVNSVAADMNVSLNCLLPSPLYLYGTQSASAGSGLGASMSDGGSGSSGGALGLSGTNAKASTHVDPSRGVGRSAAATPHSASYVSLGSGPGSVADLALSKSPRTPALVGSKLRLSPCVAEPTAAARVHDSPPPSPSSPTLLESTRIPETRRLAKRTVEESAQPVVAPLTAPKGPLKEPKTVHVRGDSRGSQQSSASKCAAPTTRSPRKHEKPKKGSKEKCTAM